MEVRVLSWAPKHMSPKFESNALSQNKRERELEKIHELPLQSGESITVKQTRGDTFKIIEESVTKKGGNPTVDRTDYAFVDWDESVQDLDKGRSDASEQLGLSEHLRWEDVEFIGGEIKAPSIERVRESLRHFKIVSYCPGDL
jgi:hypothetical protein